MATCRVCLEQTGGETGYHARCLVSLFGTTELPKLDVELKQLYSLAAQMAGKMSISGVQEKVSLRLTSDKSQLQIAAKGGRYILKPESSRFSYLPQNEHVTMQLAKLVKVDLPPFGLVELKDGSIAYLIKRFDRSDNGKKLAVEDFCQLAEKRVREKYDGSAELCVRILRKHASEPLIEIRKLYRLLLFAWWAANGDMHLKNFSLLTTQEGIRRLSPAYDLVCTRLVIPQDDKLALPIGGRDRKLTRRKWLDFGAYCGIPGRAVRGLLADQIAVLEAGVRLVNRCLLPGEMKDQYEAILRANTAVLAA